MSVCVGLQGTKKSSSVAQGAAENITPAVSAEISSKDSAKSDSTGGGRLGESSVQSDSVTPKSAVDSAKSEVTAKPSVTAQELAGRASDDKSAVIPVKSNSDGSNPPFDVISLLNSGQTLRYCQLLLVLRHKLCSCSLLLCMLAAVESFGIAVWAYTVNLTSACACVLGTSVSLAEMDKPIKVFKMPFEG